MASANSKITRKKVVAYARKTKGGGDSEAEGDTTEKAPDGEPIVVEPTDGNPKPGDGPKSATANAAPAETVDAPKVEPPAPDAAPTAAPDAPTGSMFARNKGQTIAMPPNLAMGSAPPMPTDAGPVEAPTELPDPKAVPKGDPSEAAPPPGRVPSGDSRSLRKGTQFALIYRRKTHLVTRVGTVGQQGTWRVVEYPTLGAAANAYAHECSRFVGDGFVDYR